MPKTCVSRTIGRKKPGLMPPACFISTFLKGAPSLPPMRLAPASPSDLSFNQFSLVKRENWLNEDNLVLDETFLTHLITSLEFELVLYATLQRVVLSPLW